MFMNIAFCHIDKFVRTLLLPVRQQGTYLFTETVKPGQYIIQASQLGQLFGDINAVRKLSVFGDFALQQIMEICIDINASTDCLGFIGLILREQFRKFTENFLQIMALILLYSGQHGFFKEINVEFPFL